MILYIAVFGEVFIIRKRIIPGLCIIFAVWFIISVYFYCQHYIIVKKYTLDKEIKFEDAIVKIKEITIENYSPRKQDEIEAYKGPWYWEFAKMLPVRLQAPFLKTCYFYSRPYQFNNDYGVLRLKGMIMFKSFDDIPEICNNIEIYAYDGDANYFGRGMRLTHDNNSNIILFEVKGDHASFKNNIFNIVIKDKIKKETKQIVVSPGWEIKTYNIFKGRPFRYEFDPYEKVSEFITLLRQGSKEEAKKYIHPDMAAKFPWARLEHSYWKMRGNEYVNYEGDYGGFEKAYSLNITFAELVNQNSVEPNSHELAKQKIYFTEKNNACLVIDADPVTILSGGKQPR